MRRGGSRANCFRSAIAASCVFFAAFSLRLACSRAFLAFSSSLNSFFFRLAGAFVFFFAAVALRPFTFSVAASSLGDLAACLTARFTGREGSPTAFLGLPGRLGVVCAY